MELERKPRSTYRWFRYYFNRISTISDHSRDGADAMPIDRRHFLSLVGAAAAAPALPSTGWALGYPSRPVRVIVPYPAGGPNDTIARLFTSKLSERWPQPIYIENIPAGAGNVGTAAAARAPADGYSLVVVTSSFVINPSLYPRIAYDPIKDFAPVTMIAAAPHVLVVHPSFPARDIKEFVRLLRANPGKYSYASAGTGQSSHLAGELFKLAAGIDLVHVPFNGAAPAMTSTIGGHTPIAFVSLPAAADHIRTGKLRALATTGSVRSRMHADIPTMAEAGFPDQESVFMQGILFPAGTPEDIVDLWYREMSRLASLPDVHQRIDALGFDLVVNSPEEFRAQIRSELAHWSKIVREAQIKSVE
jgi:tripartite-type tricarboxylate transporter receptor subunit TctC